MKKIISFAISICLMICFTGCVNSDSSKTVLDRFEKIVGEPYLYYDINTKVVYFINGGSISKMSPYYADNGFPYVYNVESNELEETDVIEGMLK